MSETRICANCGAEHPIDEMFQVENDWLCENCADRLTVICDHCERPTGETVSGRLKIKPHGFMTVMFTPETTHLL